MKVVNRIIRKYHNEYICVQKSVIFYSKPMSKIKLTQESCVLRAVFIGKLWENILSVSK